MLEVFDDVLDFDRFVVKLGDFEQRVGYHLSMPEPTLQDFCRVAPDFQLHGLDSGQIHASFIFEACLYPLMFGLSSCANF
jgi:hypothetical protein